MIVGAVVAAVTSLVAGFVAGLLIYQKSRRWCAVCGANLRCPECVAVARPKLRTTRSAAG